MDKMRIYFADRHANSFERFQETEACDVFRKYVEDAHRKLVAVQEAKLSSIFEEAGISAEQFRKLDELLHGVGARLAIHTSHDTFEKLAGKIVLKITDEHTPRNNEKDEEKEEKSEADIDR